jgi:hypothetical protein
MNTITKFPHDGFPYRLELNETPIRICWFQCEEHVDKYIQLHKLKPKDYVKEIKSMEIVGKKPRRKSRKQ